MNKRVVLRTGEALIQLGAATVQDIEMALAAQRRMADAGDPARIGEIVVRMGLADWGDVEKAVLATGNSSSGINNIHLPPELIRRLRIMPVEIRDRKLYYAPIQSLVPIDEAELTSAAQAAGFPVDAVAVHPKSREEVARWVDRVTHVDHKLVQEEADLLCRDTHDAPLMQRFIDHVFHDALQGRASDVHFERSNESLYCWISYRIDGVLRRRITMTQSVMGAVCTRLKILAGLDISEARRPQDGRAAVKFSSRTIDLRISSVPDHDGETIVVRMLDQHQIHKLDSVFRRHRFVLERMRALAEIRLKSGGIVLVTGPTGQGKSTTLAALMWAMPRTMLKVMSIEDPVETQIPFVHQSAINIPAGNSFSSLLRAFMRQDPDVMMVGEIRDSETAQEFLRGSETGHLMLSTEHTNDCASTLGRLLNFLPEDLRRPAIFTISSSLRAILNQRLLPALCMCATEDADVTARHVKLFKLLGQAPDESWTLRKRHGCARCDGTGYYGRELMVEAAFFPAAHKLQQDIGDLMMQGVPERILHCEGVQLYTRADAVKRLLSMGLIDAPTAEAALDLALVHHE